MTAMPMLPMLARLGAVEDIDTNGWSMEMKWDGIRAIAQVEGGQATLWTRNGIAIGHQFPNLVADLERGFAEHDVILDGEIVMLDSLGRPDFELVQAYRSQQAAMGEGKPHYMVFDIMQMDRSSTSGRTYDQRRQLLQAEVHDSAFVHLPPAVGSNAQAALEQSRELGLEGIVAKKGQSTYSPGRRSPHWIKIKHLQTQEAVVGGWLTGKGQRSQTVGSLLLGVPLHGGQLQYIGRVGSGLSDRELQEIAVMVRESSSNVSPFAEVPEDLARLALWLEPRLVCEVQFSAWTLSGRLRHPTWRGWRFDKLASDVRIEARRR